MKKIILKTIIILFCSLNISFSAQDYYEVAKNKFEEKNYDESKFLFQKNIVFNPKDSNSYLYLAKIYNHEKNQKEEEKNLKTSLLLNPNNEEAVYMLINIEMIKSNYSEVKSLIDKFSNICSDLCVEIEYFNDRLKNIEPKNES
jgi:tetratricopeptide (TPR) repeat protein